MAALTADFPAACRGQEYIGDCQGVVPFTRKTVNGYRNRVLKKLQLQTEVELMHLAIRYGLVRVPGTI
jgi:hypothetical protein